MSPPRLPADECMPPSLWPDSPQGFNVTNARFAWKLRDARLGAAQTSRHIQVVRVDDTSIPQANAFAGEPVWDSGEVFSTDSLYVPYEGPPLEPHTRYHWRVRIRDHKGHLLPWSSAAWFETAFAEPSPNWPATGWVTANDSDNPQCPHLRKTFTLAARPRSARLYITARGLFEARLNGGRVGEDLLTPGWTDYTRRIEYLTYDVTANLSTGPNTLGVILADGWYAGHLGWNAATPNRHYGPKPALLAVLRIVGQDGSVRWIGTDESWQTACGPLISADLYHGEHYDARRELPGWCDAPPHLCGTWQPAVPIEFPAVELNARELSSVRQHEETPPVSMRTPSPGRCIIDFGQNLIGVIRLRITALAGTKITLRHAEMVQNDGELYTANLRSARATDIYVCCGGGRAEIFQPRFTFHGFRYVEISGLTAPLQSDDVRAVVLHTGMTPTGTFETSNPLLNQLQSCIRWGQRSNFLEVPTDCPQRDERLGWTGDAQVFIPTATFNYDVAPFYRKWLRDLTDAQRADGAFPDVAPDLLKLMYGPDRRTGNAAWADAGVICPWVLYQRYGDTDVLARNYSAMTRWIDYQESTSCNHIRPATSFGDWLALDGGPSPSGSLTPGELIGTAYFAHTTGIMAQVASLLGHTAESLRFAALRHHIVTAFNRRFVATDVRLTSDTQTAYLLALAFDLLPEASRPTAVAHLERTLKRHHYHLATGFVGTPLLAPVLTRFGRLDLAYRLLQNKTYPSWLFPVANGATTMWERWNSWTPDDGFGDVNMNSFNHYAYGSIGDWMYRTVGGLDLSEPGYRRLLLRPRPGGGLTSAAASLDTPYGLASSAWHQTATGLEWNILVPPNTTALLFPPARSLNEVRVDGLAWDDHCGIQFMEPQEQEPVLACVAGSYRLHIAPPENSINSGTNETSITPQPIANFSR